MNSIKNGIILFILISFLCFVSIMPVTCVFKTVTGINCPACGMTRSFLAIFNFNFLESIYQNILGIPLFIFLIFSIIMLIIDFLKNSFSYVNTVLTFLEKHYFLVIVILIITFIFNNIKDFIF